MMNPLNVNSRLALTVVVFQMLLAFGFRANAGEPIFPVGPGSIVAMAGGSYQTCLMSRDTLACWGSLPGGETLKVVTGYKNAKKLSVGGDGVCVQDEDDLFCSGSLAADIPKLEGIREFSMAGGHMCAIDSEGIKCWGDNSLGQCDSPTRMDGPFALSVSSGHNCVADRAGDRVTCWGDNDFGKATPPRGLRGVRALVTGITYSCAVKENELKCWGELRGGELIHPSVVAGGSEHVCAIDDDGVKCWGNNLSSDYDPTQPPPGINQPRLLGVGSYHSCALDADKVTCWGSNEFGQGNVPAKLFP